MERARDTKAGRLFVLSAPSGGGKTTLIRRLVRTVPGLVRSVSVTTRRKRPEERDGRDYEFVSLEAFRRLRRAGQLLEWARVHGAFYGTPQPRVRDALRRGKDVVLSLDVQGARQIRRVMGRRAVLIFLLPPSMEQLRRRLMARRTDSQTAIRRRLAAARREIACARRYDYTIVNDRLGRTVAQARAIITSSRRNRRGNIESHVKRIS